MNSYAIVGGVLVAGLGFAAYMALKSDSEEEVPTVAIQPSWNSDTVNAIADEETDYQDSVIISGTNVMNLIMQPAPYIPAKQADLDIPKVPNMSVTTFVQPIEQDPAVTAYINAAAEAQDPTITSSIGDVPWYYWLTPVSAAVGIGLTYSENQKAYNTMQTNAMNMKKQLSADEYQVVTNEGEINFQAWFKYEEDVSLTTGQAFTWDDTYAYAAYLAINAPDQYDSFLRAWDEYGQADVQDYLSKLQQAQPTAPIPPQKDPTLSKEEQQAQLDVYNQEKDDYRVQQQQWKNLYNSSKTMTLDQSDIANTLQIAYNLDDSTAADLGARYYQAFENQGTFAGNILGSTVNQAMGQLNAENISDPTYTLADGSVVDIYSGYVLESGTTLKKGDKAFEVTAAGDVVQKL